MSNPAPKDLGQRLLQELDSPSPDSTRAHTLIEQGASLQECDNRGITALMKAAYKCPAIAWDILYHESNSTVKAKDARGWTVLMYACAADMDNANLITSLIDLYGADPGVINEQDHNALWIAQRHQTPETLKYLEEATGAAYDRKKSSDRRHKNLEDRRHRCLKDISLHNNIKLQPSLKPSK